MISISVVMPVYNIEISMLQEAVNSILSQTFRDFEFIIIDDASTDSIYRYLKQIKDERIKLIRNSEHLGTTKSLNIGLKEAKGLYIRVVDSDDWLSTDALKKLMAKIKEMKTSGCDHLRSQY